MRRFLKQQTGTAAIEMAFVLPMFLLFVLGIIEFGRAYWTMYSMEMAIDEGGRYVMINTSATDTQIKSVVQSHLYGLNSADFTITFSSQTVSGVNYKVIHATYPFNFIVPNLLPFGAITLSRQTEVPVLP